MAPVTESPCVWPVILAGGDGVRLRPLTRLISGDDRPKQFCKIFGERSLITHTRARLSGMFAEERTLFVVTRAHEDFYNEELADVYPDQILVQPANKGTGAAIANALLHVMRRDPDAIIAFFPSDHHYRDEARFRTAITHAVEAAHSESIVLLGVEASHPETDYGWIEPGPGLTDLRSVTRFREKPGDELALDLMARGCLWNTFVMVGRARTFFRLLHVTTPDLLDAFCTADRTGNIAAAYANPLPPVDFSRDVLSHCAAYMRVVPMTSEVGWTDLGNPDRVLAELSYNRVPRRPAMSSPRPDEFADAPPAGHAVV